MRSDWKVNNGHSDLIIPNILTGERNNMVVAAGRVVAGGGLRMFKWSK